MLMESEAVEAYYMKGKSHDCGSKIGYMKANIDFALRLTQKSNNNEFGVFTYDNPFYRNESLVNGAGLTYLDHSTTVSNSSDFSFIAQAGEIYTLALGGYMGVNWNQQHDGYVLNITTSPSAVPIPAAAWLMGSGLIGLASIGRRKKQST